VNETRYGEIVKIHKLPYIISLNNDEITLPVIDEEHIQRNLLAGGFVIVIMFIIFTMPIIVDKCEKRKRKQRDSQVEHDQKKVN
jgi:hypothetical protein